MSNSPETRAAATNAVEFRGVSKRYTLYATDRHRFLGVFSRRVPHTNVYANKDLTFSIAKGESVAILGKNGAGKSTVLKMITGVVYPTKGSIAVEGRVSALLELTAGFDSQLSGRENIQLRGKIWGLDAPGLSELEEKAIEFADIGEYIDQPVRTYSSGMKARLGFAISANINPDILIIDEALSVGDSAFRKKCDARIREIMRTEGVTVLLVTHSAASAESICSRGLVLKQGKLVFDGPIAEAIEFYEGPRDPEDKVSDAFIDV